MQLQIQKQTLTKTMAREQTKQRVVKKENQMDSCGLVFFFTLFLLFYILGQFFSLSKGIVNLRKFYSAQAITSGILLVTL